MKKILLTLLIICFTTHSRAFASGIPTVDILGNLMKAVDMIENVMQTANQVEQIANQVNQVRNQLQRISQAEREFNAMTGNYGMGRLLNGSVQRNSRRYVPNNWHQLKSVLNSTGLSAILRDAGNKTRESRDQGEQYPTESVFIDQDQKNAVVYKEEGDRLYATMGASQTAYERSSNHFDEIEDMTDQIDSANDLKAAVDLGNRIDSENALLMNEMIRQVSISNIQQAENREYRRNQLGADLHRADMTIPDITQ